VKDQLKMKLSDIHQMIFTEMLPELGYSIELFLEDLDHFPTAHEGYLTLDEIITFIQSMQ
jgi:hypothetical protein